MVARTSLLFLDEHWRMPSHQDVELVAGSYGTQRDAELAGGGLHFDPSPAYVSGGESRKKLRPAGRHPTRTRAAGPYAHAEERPSSTL